MQLGYPGIIFMMALESSFFPFPSEIVIPPAAYLASRGEMDLSMIILCGVIGSLLGAVLNYWIALKLGRPFFEKYGRYFFVKQASLHKADLFFEKHGPISIFTGRLLPVIRQYISLPAGLTEMNFFMFSSATVLGSAIWVIILALLGYFLGMNEAAITENLHWISLFISVFCGILFFLYRRMKVRATDT